MAHRALTEDFLLKSGLFLLRKRGLWIKQIRRQLLRVRLLSPLKARLLLGGTRRRGVGRWGLFIQIWTASQLLLLLGNRWCLPPIHHCLILSLALVSFCEKLWLRIIRRVGSRWHLMSRLGIFLSEILRMHGSKHLQSLLNGVQFWCPEFWFELGGWLLVVI